MLVDILGVLLGDFLRMIPRVFNLGESSMKRRPVIILTGCYLFNLFDALELNQ